MGVSHRGTQPCFVSRRGSSSSESALSTLGVWDAHLARVGGEILAERLRLVTELRTDLEPHLVKEER